MLSFEITAIDLVLVIAVIALLFLYVIKLANSPEELIKKSLEQSAKHQTASAESKNDSSLKVNAGFSECPRGFGKIKGIVRKIYSINQLYTITLMHLGEVLENKKLVKDYDLSAGKVKVMLIKTSDLREL